MRFLDLIETKKGGGALQPREIDEAIRSYVGGEVPDYQMAALLMAIRWRGLDDEETAQLTRSMVESGERYDWSGLSQGNGTRCGRPCVDKHSTGGVGDKISICLAPLAAVCGLLVPMVSGRGLGHTGGTLDKLESIPGMRTDLSRDEFASVLERVGVAMGGQTRTFVPADRKLYALRDATATVDDSGLITASILSKKIAEGADALVLDVKAGSGAFCVDLQAARDLARRLRDVARREHLECVAVVTDMDQPLGSAVGNANEIAECLRVLRRDPDPDGAIADIRELTTILVAEMLVVSGVASDLDSGLRTAITALDDGRALERLGALIEAQGGNPRVIDDPSLLPAAVHEHRVFPPRPGYVGAIQARQVGEAAIALRAGRSCKEDVVDPAAGLRLVAKRGDALDPGQPWARVFFNDGADVERADRLLASALTVAEAPPPPRPLVLERHA